MSSGPNPGRRLRAVLVAPPGAGKGTQAERLSAHFRVAHLSTGELFRREVTADTPLGRQVSVYLDRGDLVPDELVDDLVRREVERVVTETGGFLLDGFPRTVGQAERAHRWAVAEGLTADAVLTFDVPPDVLLARLTSRARAEGRADDTSDTIRHRLDVYQAETLPLLDYYRGRGLLVSVAADRPVDAVTAACVDVLEALLARVARPDLPA